MKKSDVLKQQRAALEAEIKPLLEAADLNEEQKRLFDEKQARFDELAKEIAREEKREAMILHMAGSRGQEISEKEERDLSAYSFVRAINGQISGKLDGLEAEMHIEGQREIQGMGKTVKGLAIPLMVLNRASTGQNVATAADGGNLVQADPMIFVESLKNALVLVQMGAKFLPGLVGNVPLINGGAFSASWVAEGNAVTATKVAYSKSTLTPKNLMVAGALSKQLLNQTAGLAEKLVRDELIAAIAQGLQTAAINGSGAPAPTGILNTSGIGSVAGGTDGAVPTWGNIVDLETEVNIDNVVGEIKYLTNSKVVGKLKQTLKSAGVAGYILDGDMTNGRKLFTTNAVPSNLVKGSSGAVCSAIIAGVWEELFIGTWGGLDIVVDPYTKANQNEVALWINQFADVALRNVQSFAAMKDAKTV